MAKAVTNVGSSKTFATVCVRTLVVLFAGALIAAFLL
jgi:hypothetical protein